MIEKLREITEKKLITTTNEQEKEKLLLIKKIISDSDCFKKITIDTAYTILYDLGFDKKQVREIYQTLIVKNTK